MERLRRIEVTSMRSGVRFLGLALLVMQPWPNRGAFFFFFFYASVFSYVTYALSCDFSSVNSAM